MHLSWQPFNVASQSFGRFIAYMNTASDRMDDWFAFCCLNLVEPAAWISITKHSQHDVVGLPLITSYNFTCRCFLYLRSRIYVCITEDDLLCKLVDLSWYTCWLLLWSFSLFFWTTAWWHKDTTGSLMQKDNRHGVISYWCSNPSLASNPILGCLAHIYQVVQSIMVFPRPHT